MSNVIEDKILFILPKERELQFPAMAVAQQFINTYDRRMAKNDVSGGRYVYQLTYHLDMPAEDWAFWQKIELKLAVQPSKISEPDMIADFSEEKLKQFDVTGKHVCQIFGVICGMESKPCPVIRQVKPKTDEARWAILQETFHHPVDGPDEIAGVDLIQVKDEEWTGIIGRASWQTYLAASMGLPTIETLPAGRSRSWMSKFFQSHYRMVEEVKGNVKAQIEQAVASIESIILKPCTETLLVKP